jgi:hypothetical protein
MLQKILLQCRLVQFRRAVGYSPLLAAWQEFFREFELDEVEVTYYSINRKRRIYIRLGAWDKASHPSRTPAEIWSAAVAGKVSTPRLRITALCNELESSIGAMDFDDLSSEDDGELSTSTTSESESESALKVESEPESEAEVEVVEENMKSTVNESVNVFLNFHCCTLFSHRIHRVMFLINY